MGETRRKRYVAGDGTGVADGWCDDGDGAIGVGGREVLLKPSDVERQDNVGEKVRSLDRREPGKVDEGMDEAESLALALEAVEDGGKAVDVGEEGSRPPAEADRPGSRWARYGFADFDGLVGSGEWHIGFFWPKIAGGGGDEAGKCRVDVRAELFDR